MKRVIIFVVSLVLVVLTGCQSVTSHLGMENTFVTPFQADAYEYDGYVLVYSSEELDVTVYKEEDVSTIPLSVSSVVRYSSESTAIVVESSSSTFKVLPTEPSMLETAVVGALVYSDISPVGFISAITDEGYLSCVYF